jgi:hypothetical protein
MKIIFKAMNVAFIIIPLIVSAEGPRSDFVRQIDKPLQDVKGTRRLSFDIAGEKRLHYDTLSVKVFPGFSYAVTDRITFCDLPWPVLQVRVKPSRTGAAVSDGLDALALSLRVGVTSSSLITELNTQNGGHGYFDDYIRIFTHIGLLAKMPISGSFWTQCDITASTVIEEAIQGYFYPRIGYQFTKNIYGIIGYRGGFFRFSDDFNPPSKISYMYRYAYSLDYYHSSNADKSSNPNVSYSSTMPVSIGIDLGRHFSTIVATSVGKQTGVFVPIELQFQVSW